MRRTLTLVLCLVVAGCASHPRLPRTIPDDMNCTVLDFSKYRERGFLITPEPYGGKYESVGILNCTFRSGAQEHVWKEYREPGGWSPPGTGGTKSRWTVEPLDVDGLLDLAYEEAVQRGGNAIMNFRVNLNVEDVHSGAPPLPKLEVSGFIIRRLD